MLISIKKQKCFRCYKAFEGKPHTFTVFGFTWVLCHKCAGCVDEYLKQTAGCKNDSEREKL